MILLVVPSAQDMASYHQESVEKTFPQKDLLCLHILKIFPSSHLFLIFIIFFAAHTAFTLVYLLIV